MKNAVFIPLEILKQQDLPFFVKLVYGRVAHILGKNNQIIMTTDEIAMQCGISRRNAAKALPELAKLGLVKPHESLEGHGLLRIFERQEPIDTEAKRYSEPKKSNPPKNSDLPKNTEEN